MDHIISIVLSVIARIVIAILVIALFCLGALVLQLLWNWLMPIFNLPTLTFWQFLVLSFLIGIVYELAEWNCIWVGLLLVQKIKLNNWPEHVLKLLFYYFITINQSYFDDINWILSPTFILFLSKNPAFNSNIISEFSTELIFVNSLFV